MTTALTEDPRVRVLERRTTPGLLGLRFWDVAAGVQVKTANLGISARTARNQTAVAVANQSGVWHFPRLPGVDLNRVIERAEAGLSVATLARPFTIRVCDLGGASSAPASMPSRRSADSGAQQVSSSVDLASGEGPGALFQTIEFDVLAPVDGGLFDWPFGGDESGGVSPPASGLVPLFPVASRVAPAGRLTVRADVWDIDRKRPASWALVELVVPGPLGAEVSLGLCDRRGCATVFLPVPFVPLDGSRLPASARSWTVDVRVSYAPASTIDRLGSSALGASQLPLLEWIMEQRAWPAAAVFATSAVDVEMTTATLRATEPLVLQTNPEGLDSKLRGHLLVRPAP